MGKYWASSSYLNSYFTDKNIYDIIITEWCKIKDRKEASLYYDEIHDDVIIQDKVTNNLIKTNRSLDN